MKRRLLNLLTALSLLLCLGSVALLVRSHFVSDWVVRQWVGRPTGNIISARDWSIDSADGVCLLRVAQYKWQFPIADGYGPADPGPTWAWEKGPPTPPYDTAGGSTSPTRGW